MSATSWAIGHLDLHENCFDDLEVGVSTRQASDGADQFPVVDAELSTGVPGSEFSFTVTMRPDGALELADELREAAGVGRRTPDDRSIDDIAAVSECKSCGWTPAATILTAGSWECYNCGGATGGDDA